jgi:hypothetical protein
MFETYSLCFFIWFADPHLFSADPYLFSADPDPSFHFNEDPDPTLHFNVDVTPYPAPYQSDANMRPLV